MEKSEEDEDNKKDIKLETSEEGKDAKKEFEDIQAKIEEINYEYLRRNFGK